MEYLKTSQQTMDHSTFFMSLESLLKNISLTMSQAHPLTCNEMGKQKMQ